MLRLSYVRRAPRFRKQRNRRPRFERLEERALLTTTPASPLVDAFYQDVLSRTAEPQGLAYWTQQLAAGVSGSQFAAALLTSHEYHQDVVDGDYDQLFGRSAEPPALNFWGSLLDHGVQTSGQVLIGLLGSDEYYALHNRSNAQFIVALYLDVLGRDADPGAVNYWLAQMSGPTNAPAGHAAIGLSRADVAGQFVTGAECQTKEIDEWYQDYLDRPASDDDIAFWNKQFAGGHSPDMVLATILGSDEYRVRIGKNKPAIEITNPAAGIVTNLDPAIAGQVTGHGTKPDTLKAAVDSGAFAAVKLERDEKFSLPLTLPLNGSADGAHTVHFKLSKPHGETAATTDFSFTLDTTSPTVTISSPAPGNIASHNETITGQVADATSGVAALTAAIDAGAFASIAFDASGNFSFATTLSLDGTADGPHTVRFKATDKAGNTSVPTDFSFTLDTVAPAVTISTPGVGDLTGENETIAGHVADATSGLAALVAAVDGGAFAPVTVDSSGAFSFATALPLDGSADGSHSVHLKATDEAGNVSAPALLAFTIDTTAPVVTISSPANGDLTSHNETITGHVADATSGVASLQIAIDAGPFVPVTIDASGNFSFLTTLPLDGTADGPHTVRLEATDRAYNTSAPATLTFTLATESLTISAFDLAPGSETGTPGDHTTDDARVTLVGQTDPGASVSLIGLGLTALASSSGAFEFPDVSLAPGDNSFTAQAADAQGNTSQAALTVHRVTPSGQTDPVIQWNENLLAAIQLDASDPQIASRAMAMAQSAVYDAVNAVEGKAGHLVTLTAPAGASAPAAVSQAAHDVLAYLYPAQQATFDAELAASLALVADGQPKTDGRAMGAAAASAIVALRADDGSKSYVSYMPGTGPGVWQPTAPTYAEALEPQWAQLTPWTMTSDSEFRPAGPPALTSAAWATAVNQTQSLGAADSTTRTADQTQIARFWSDGGGTATPPGHWNEIAEQVAASEGNSLDENARLFAELDVGLADAAIVAWDAKYAYNAWRPITAIPDADSAGNPAVTPDPNWKPLLITPNFPEYVSGHSTFSGTAAGILDAVFGANTSFTIGSDALPGVTRSFTGFDQAAQEAGMSRIYAGIHFEFSDADGRAAGTLLAQHVLATFDTAKDTSPPTVTLISPMPGEATTGDPILIGRVTDNLSGVKSLVVALDGGAFAPIAFDAAGSFTVPTTLALDGTADGLHTLAFSATDAAGNASAVTSFTFTLDTKPPVITLTAPLDGDALAAGAELTGSVDPTGSPLVALSYTIDGDTTTPIAFDTMAASDVSNGTAMSAPAPDDFSQALDLSKLAAGTHMLVVSALDAAGNSTQASVAFSLAAAIPLSVTGYTPANGAADVGVTYRPQITFSRAIDTTTLMAADFFATDSTGTVIPATIVPANDGTFAWLFFTNPMPGASIITVTVDGSRIKAADGSLLDAVGSGTPGSKLIFSFTTVNTAPVPGTSLSGIVADPGPDLLPGTRDDVAVGPDGVLMTTDDVYKLPIAGVKVYILGHEDEAVYTAADGSFTLSPIPTGDVKLALDGMTAGNPPAGYYFANMVMDLHVQPGVNNTVMAAMADSDAKAQANPEPGVYLPRLQTSLLQTVNDTQGATIATGATSAPELTPDQRGELKIDIAPNSLIGADGKPLSSAQVGISTVPPQLVADMLPAGLLQHTFDITVQAPGVAVFSSPASLTFPNVFNSPPGTKLNLLSFDHTTGRLVIEGTATVSADGKSVTTDPGVGVIHPGWHGITPPGDPPHGPRPQPDPRPRPKPSDPNEKCRELGNVAAISTAECALGPIVGLFSDDPVIGCVISFGVTLAGDALQYKIAPSTFTAQSFGEDMLGAAIGCIPGEIGSVLGSFYGCSYQMGEALKDYHDCMYPPSPATNVSAQALAATPADNPFFDQAQILADSANVFSIFFGSADWTSATPAELPKWNAFVAELGRDVAPGSEGGTTIVAAEAARLAALPLPASVSTADERALVDRMGHLFQNDFSAIGFDPQAFGDAAQQLELDASRLADQGWTTEFSGFKLGIQQLSQMIDGSVPIVGTVGGQAVAADMAVSAQTTSAETSSTPPLGLYWRLTDLNTGFELRGQFAPTQTSFENLFLAPNSVYSVEYVDPTTLRYASNLFFTGPSGSRPQIPASAFSDSPETTDTDADGIPDLLESVLGTDPTKYSTAGDGISDLAKIQQGLDPLSNHAFATGVVASLPMSGEAQQVVLAGSTANATQQTAYIATGSYGLAIVDASQFQKPVLVSQLELPGDATGVSVDSNLQIAAVADGSGGLEMIDVSNPSQPQVTYTNTDAATQVIAVDGVAYAAIPGGALASYDMLTGDRLQVLFLTSGNITGLAREGDLIYVMDDANTLHVVDISQPLMVGRGYIVLPDGGGGLVVGGDIAYVAATSNVYGGYETVNVSDPDQPALIARSSATQTAAAPDPVLAVNGSGIVLAANGAVRGATAGVQLYDSSDAMNTGNFLTDLSLSASPANVAIASGIAFVADGSAGLQVVNYLPFDTKGKAPTVSVDASSLDTDPNTPGIQVLEASNIRLNATVSDDVQVRDVELLVNGQVAVNDVSFPFDLSTFLPSTIEVGGSVTIEVKATDTGGNTASTGPITLNLTHDTTPPAIVGTSPAVGATRGQNFRTVIVDFSKPMDPATITASTIVVTGPGVSLMPDDVQFRFHDTEVQLTFPAATLPFGSYQLVMHAASITDLAGNSLGNADVVVPFSIAHVDTWINPAGGDWSVPTNWDGGQVPQTGDDVLIDVPGSPTITYGFASGATTLHSLVSKDPFTMTGGTLTATQSIEVDSTFTITRGTIKNTLIQAGSGGQGVTIAGASTCTFDGVTSNADIRFANPNGSAQLAIANGLTLNGTAYLGQGAYSDSLLFNGTQSLAGTGTIVLGASNGVMGMNLPGTLTIGSGITIHGQRGILNFYSPGSFINQGTIIADVPDQAGISVNTGFVNQGTMRAVNNGRLTLRGVWSNTASGSITSDASTLNLGSDNSTWTNAGIIQAVNGSAVNLGGLFTLTGLGSFTAGTSTVNLTGTLDNTNTTLALNAATGPWNVRGGTLKGGSYTSADGSQLLFGSGTLDGVTLNSDVTIPSSVTILDGLTLNAVIHLGTASLPGTLSFSGAQELAGSGTIVLGSNDSNQISASGTLTVDSGITIRGQAGTLTGAVLNEGTIAADTPGDSFGVEIVGAAPGMINQGTIRAANGSILYVAGMWTNAATGTIAANASTLWLGNGTNPWNNAGTITSTNGSTVNLESKFTVADLGNFQRSGGTVNLYGTLNNTATTLALNAATGSWRMGSGGAIIGGDYTSADGASLVISSNNGTFDGVTIDGDLYVAGQNPAAVIKNNLTLNGTIYLGDTTSGQIGSLLYFGSQTLSGTGSVVFVGSSGNGIGPQLLSTTLAIGSGITIRGQSGAIYGFGSGSAVIDAGVVSADVAGGAISINGTSFTNQGTLRASGGGLLNVAGLVLPMAGTITAGAGGIVAVSGDLTLNSASTVNVELAGTTTDKLGRVTVSGKATLNGTLNISLVNNFQPNSGDAFKVMTYGSATGQFAAVNGGSIPNSLVLTPAENAADLTLTAGAAMMGAAIVNSPASKTAALHDRVFAELGLGELD